tara:strand:+ start:481 stop:615 length:135 start_codon:yes stop_codon:yes gene_type:complete
MTVRKQGKKFLLVSKEGKTLGTHSSRKEAEAQEAAINISKKKKK